MSLKVKNSFSLLHIPVLVKSKNVQGGPKKSLQCDLEEKCLRNSKMFFNGVFLSIHAHLLKKLELSKLYRKKVIRL